MLAFKLKRSLFYLIASSIAARNLQVDAYIELASIV